MEDAMHTNWHKALLVSFVLITSSLAGCLGDDETDDEWTVMVSTYHVGEIAKAIGGSSVNVEMMSLDNIPVHDYEPSVKDISRLADVDLFLYHGLGLEPWVDETLDSMGGDAPMVGMTHALPSGEVDLDFESILVSDLCKTITNGPFETLELSLDRNVSEIHAEYVAHNLVAAEHDEDHDDEHHDEDGHDDHDDHDDHGHEDHGDHDEHGHEGHDHTMAEETISEPENCPEETMISIFHLEEGEYFIEFESEHHDEDFSFAVLKMLGAHAHHHHDHGDHGDDHDDHDDDHGDDHDDHDDDHDDDHHDDDHDDDHRDEDGHDDDHHDDDHHDDDHHDDDRHDDDHHDEEITPAVVLEMFDANNDSSLSWQEFWDSWYEDEEDLEDQDTLSSMFNESDADSNGLLNSTELEGFIPQLMEFDMGHEEHEREHNEDILGFAMIHIEAEGEYGFVHSHELEIFLMMTEGHDDHDDHDDHGHGEEAFEWAGVFQMDDNTHTWSMQKVGGDYADPSMRLVLIPTDSPTEETMHSLEEAAERLIEGDCTVVEDGESMSSIATDGSCFELHVGTGDDSTFTMETSGFAGMAMYAQHVPTEFERDQHYLKDSQGVDVEPIAQEGAGAHDHGHHDDDEGHDDHDDHEGHDDHDDHDDHSDEEDGMAYDPHSWLDPVAYKTQVEVVLGYMIKAFPDGESDFTANAEKFMDELDDLDAEYSAALADDVCPDKLVVANHNAYSYMALRYDMKFLTVHGLDPEGEPSPEDIVKVVDHIKEENIDVLFIEEYTSASSVQSIVDETGVSIEYLYTMEMAPSDSSQDYISLMYKNLENLKSGLSC